MESSQLTTAWILISSLLFFSILLLLCEYWNSKNSFFNVFYKPGKNETASTNCVWLYELKLFLICSNYWFDVCTLLMTAIGTRIRLVLGWIFINERLILSCMRLLSTRVGKEGLECIHISLKRCHSIFLFVYYGHIWTHWASTRHWYLITHIYRLIIVVVVVVFIL